jgi:prefoldin alpha subunit
MSDTVNGENSGGRTIQLDSMSLEELNRLKQQEEERLQALTSRYAALRQAAARIGMSQRAVSDLKKASESNHVMVPLTESVYVPGLVKEPNKLLVELGTGFYVEKGSKDALLFLDRKMKLVDANSDNVTKAVQATNQNLEAVKMTMQGKLIEIRARQEGARHRAAVEG